MSRVEEDHLGFAYPHFALDDTVEAAGPILYTLPNQSPFLLRSSHSALPIPIYLFHRLEAQ